VGSDGRPKVDAMTAGGEIDWPAIEQRLPHLPGVLQDRDGAAPFRRDLDYAGIVGRLKIGVDHGIYRACRFGRRKLAIREEKRRACTQRRQLRYAIAVCKPHYLIGQGPQQFADPGLQDAFIVVLRPACARRFVHQDGYPVISWRCHANSTGRHDDEH
jgi:hypothetical protein